MIKHAAPRSVKRTTRLIVFMLLAGAASQLNARPVPQNLGNGLDKLVESNLILSGEIPAPPTDPSGHPDGTVIIGGNTVSTYGSYATRQAANYATHAIRDLVANQWLVDIHPSGTVPFNNLRDSLTSKFATLRITAVDTKYRGVGVIEGYVSLADVVALSQTDGVRSAQLCLKPYHSGAKKLKTTAIVAAPLGSVGSTFDQGVTQHRVDKINRLYNPGASVDWEGAGMSIGCLSDSFNTSGSGSESADVGSRDLPGPGNPINPNAVVVLQDFPGGTDEGRGMCQIAYKMAPKATIGFATADTGEVGFANNIRALAGLQG